jgi:hypothetical protein
MCFLALFATMYGLTQKKVGGYAALPQIEEETEPPHNANKVDLLFFTPVLQQTDRHAIIGRYTVATSLFLCSILLQFESLDHRLVDDLLKVAHFLRETLLERMLREANKSGTDAFGAKQRFVHFVKTGLSLTHETDACTLIDAWTRLSEPYLKTYKDERTQSAMVQRGYCFYVMELVSYAIKPDNADYDRVVQECHRVTQLSCEQIALYFSKFPRDCVFHCKYANYKALRVDFYDNFYVKLTMQCTPSP